MRSMATARRRPPEGDSSAKDSKAGRRGKRGRTRPRRQDRGAFYTAEKNMLEFGLFAVEHEHEIAGVSDLVSAQEKCGGCSSVGRVPDCDSGCRGFESHQPPHRIQMKSGTCAKAGCLFSFPDGGRIRQWWHASGAALNLDHVLAVVHPPGGGGVGVGFPVLMPAHQDGHILPWRIVPQESPPTSWRRSPSEAYQTRSCG